MKETSQKLFDLAQHISTWSPCRKAKVGAVLYDPSTMSPLISSFNELPKGLDYDEEMYHSKPMKGYVWAHAERNVICLAAKLGIRTEGMGLAVNWYPCAACAISIVQAGITHMVAEQPDLYDPSWADDFRAAAIVIDAARIDIDMLPPTRWKPTASSPKLDSRKGGGILVDFPKADQAYLEPLTSTLEPVS